MTEMVRVDDLIADVKRIEALEKLEPYMDERWKDAAITLKMQIKGRIQSALEAMPKDPAYLKNMDIYRESVLKSFVNEMVNPSAFLG